MGLTLQVSSKAFELSRLDSLGIRRGYTKKVGIGEAHVFTDLTRAEANNILARLIWTADLYAMQTGIENSRIASRLRLAAGKWQRDLRRAEGAGSKVESFK